MKVGGKKPIFKHTAYLKRGAQQFRKDFDELDSTNYARTMQKGVKDF